MRAAGARAGGKRGPIPPGESNVDRSTQANMTDPDTKIVELRELVRQFVDERDWQQFHSPKNLAMALAIEAAELMEHFQWLSPDASRGVRDQPEKLAQVGEELADVLCYVLAMANELNLDLSTTLRRKMEHNARKYPAHEFRGRYGPEDAGRHNPRPADLPEFQ
jgi:NTP pyrophosphatase (non-canonical NTP hydrolase)